MLCDNCKELKNEHHVLLCTICDQFICVYCLEVGRISKDPDIMHTDHVMLNIGQLKKRLEKEFTLLRLSVNETMERICSSSAEDENFMQKISMGVAKLNNLIAPTVSFLINPAIYWQKFLRLQSNFSFDGLDLNELENVSDAIVNMCNQANDAISLLRQIQILDNQGEKINENKN